MTWRIFLNSWQDVLRKPVAMPFKEQIARKWIPVVQCFPTSRSQSSPGWPFPKQLSLCPSCLCNVWNSQREGGVLEATMSPLWLWSGFCCQEIPLFRDLLSASSNPHPHPPVHDFKALWKWKVALLHKKIGGDKVINTYFVRESIGAPSLNIHLACWKGNLFQKHWAELTNSLCM